MSHTRSAGVCGSGCVARLSYLCWARASLRIVTEICEDFRVTKKKKKKPGTTKLWDFFFLSYSNTQALEESQDFGIHYNMKLREVFLDPQI